MSQDLLRDALERAGRLAPAVRSAALCHIARVLSRSDQAEARAVLEEGLALAAGLPDPEEREILLSEGAVLAATIVPARALEVYSTLTGERRQVLSQLLWRMADHGFGEAATEYLLNSGADSADVEFQFGTAMHLVGPSDDLDTKRRMLRRAIAAMRETDARGESRPFGAHDFVQFFTFYWRLLPEEEARAALREHVQRILSKPDSAMNGGFSAGSVKLVFTSRHQQALFDILEPLQELAPDLAASIIPRYPELSAAAWRFPYGQRSLTEQMEKEAAAAREAAPPDAGWIDYVGSTPIEDALRTDFADPFAVAMDEYDADADPDDYNEIPQQCWPSAAAFRTILYKAGQYEGAAAARHLDRIADPALKLFAQIELAAALAGLPQLGSTTMRRGSRARRQMERAAAQGPSGPAEIPPGLRPLPPPRKPDVPPSRELRVSPATDGADEGTSGGSGRDFVEIRNASLSSVVSHLFETPPVKIEWPPSIDPAARYDFLLVLPTAVSDEERWRLLREGIATYFSVRMSVEERVKPVWVLTAPNGISVRARRTPPMSGFGGMGSSSIGISSRHMSGNPRASDAIRLHEILPAPDPTRDTDPGAAFERMQSDMARALGAMAGGGAAIDGLHGELTIPELCAMLEAGLDRPLIDETGLGGRYVMAFDSDAGGSFAQALADRLGLVLTAGQRAIPVLVVSPQ